MNKICIVGYNFGDNYQNYVPMFIYSVLKAYPNYSVKIFSTNNLKPKIWEKINKLEHLGDFEIYENFNFDMKNTKSIKKYGYYQQALRWFFYHESFDEYDYIYIGDLDIFICREDLDLCEQHILHMKQIKLPYSNSLRVNLKENSFSIKRFIKLLKNRDSVALKKLFNNKPIEERRLTGLHFIEREKYYKEVRKHFYYFHSILLGEVKTETRNDEELLYELISLSDIDLPPISPNKPDLDPLNYLAVNFRPHHGLHFGLFRDNRTMVKEHQILQSDVYKGYFDYFFKLYINDKLLRDILYLEDWKYNYITKRIIDYYYDESNI
ncbi:hypothetical protein ACFO4L_01000 [Bacillus daqingensis]|uniref:Lipopolysaccharide biosynthesis protein, LPS:glycosyltransferase n=1 Tax=Bacillus daqingensis TaxID=872396 RepID=A0ABV9NP56_9BACI